MAAAKKSTSSKAPKKEIRIGVIGSAAASPKSVKSLLTDFIPAQQKKGNVAFVLPVTAELFSAGVKNVADVLIELEIPYDVIVTEKSKRARTLKPYIANAANEHLGERGLPQKIVTLIGKGDVATLLALYDEDDADLEKALEKAFGADVPVLDLAQALDPLEAADDEEEEETEDEESDDEEETEEEDEDEEEDDEDEEPPAKKAAAKKSSKKPAAKEEDDDEDDEEEDDEDDDEPTKPAESTDSVAAVLVALGTALIGVAKTM